nr:helix-turn-helix domain-containing protein [Neisseria meningitidis]
MSVKLMSAAWDMDLPMGQKMLLLALCDHANDDGVCYPSQEKLAKKCSMGERTVISHIQWLERHGIVSRERRQNTQRRKSDLYQITLGNYTAEPANSAPANSAPAKFSPEPANFAPSEPANFAPSYKEEPSVFNHQIEPSWVGSGIAAAPEAEILEAETPKSAKQKTADEKIRANPDNVKTWNAYAAAYRRRYGILPESNRKTRGQVAQFVKLVGAEKAPLLAAYFPTHNGRWFVQCRHEFGLLLKSYQQIATDYATGQQMTETRARQAESTQANLESHNGALEILKKHYGLE